VQTVTLSSEKIETKNAWTPTARGEKARSGDVKIDRTQHVDLVRSDLILAVITDLSDSSYFVKDPIPAIIEKCSRNDFVAFVPTTGLAMSGDSIPDALRGLKCEIAATFALYKSEPKLGPEPLRILRYLEGHIGQGRKQTTSKRR
jgi:hypothetical protein